MSLLPTSDTLLHSHRFRERYQPIKDNLRKVRQTLPAEVKEPSERLYAFTNIVYYLIKVNWTIICR